MILRDTFNSLIASGHTVLTVHYVKDSSVRHWPLSAIFYTDKKEHNVDLTNLDFATFKKEDDHLDVTWQLHHQKK